MEKWRIEAAARKEMRLHLERESKRIRRANNRIKKSLSALSEKHQRLEGNHKKLARAVDVLICSGKLTKEAHQILMAELHRE